MDTISAAALARELGTTIPRVVRAIERLGLEARRDNGRVALEPSDAALLRTELGVALPRVPGLTPTAIKVLAALSRAPLGLTSARTVARRAGVSPTAAGHAIDLLRKRGLVTVQRRTLPAGRARQFDVIALDYRSPTWQQLADTIATVSAPTPQPHPAARRVPARLGHLFWNTAPSQLDTRRAGPYIARRLLTTGDPDGLAWGLANLAPSDWRHAARTRGLSPRRRALARNFASQPNGVFEGAKVQFLDAHTQVKLAPPERHEGILVASIPDVFATKIKVIGDRGELRDYFDLKRIEELTGRRVEEGIGLYMTRYQVPPEHPSIEHIVEALGYLDDIDEDDAIPESRKEIAKYWARRQREIAGNLSRFPDA